MKKYLNPELRITQFSIENVILASAFDANADKFVDDVYSEYL